jgi:hypothetical protein
MQNNKDIKELVITFEYVTDLPYDNYVAYIDDETFGKHVVAGNSFSECLKEISISMRLQQSYKNGQA